MIKNILGVDFKYENDKMYRFNKWTKKWSCCNDLKPNARGYNIIGINNKGYRLHRIIYKYHNEDFDITYSPENQIDHININPLDNRIENLRVVNSSENQRNRKKRKNASSKCNGVCRDKLINKWRASITINRIVYYIGSYDIEEEASEAYEKYKREKLMNI
mgnify:CR=1 FL=1